MSDKIIDLIIMVISILTVMSYLNFIKRKYGIQQSISASADLKKDDISRSPLFFWWFIVPLTIPAMYVCNTPLTTIGGSLLLLIGLFTGYNENFYKKELQNNLHFGFVATSIILFELGLILINPWFLLYIIPFIIVLIYIAIKQPLNYIWLIEEFIIYQIWIMILW